MNCHYADRYYYTRGNIIPNETITEIVFDTFTAPSLSNEANPVRSPGSLERCLEKKEKARNIVGSSSMCGNSKVHDLMSEKISSASSLSRRRDIGLRGHTYLSQKWTRGLNDGIGHRDGTSLKLVL
ncbi:uncharacterized protein ARMOST_02147 [Armillaria ostoyae]|uniref:Uncharacterized protein n=1 Tax=Armillaria ostoyae TaxID=47428 RepID=A0A284QQW7_ARMOS|nr:uncharacterized protein ARMOST_02147 [Armillaria ostoyae]